MTRIFLGRILSSGFSLFLYAAIAFLLFGIRLYPDFYHQYLGTGTDPKGVIWIMSYWQNCIHNFSDLFVNGMSWAPFKFNLTQTQPMMLVGLLNKVLSIKNPIFALNFWLLISLILSAWSAFFLCWYVSKSYWASLIGGYLYGFSSYMIAQLMAHLVCVLVFFIPLLILLYLLLMNQNIHRLLFLLLFSLILTIQFYLYAESVVMIGVLGSLVLIFGMTRYAGDYREKIIKTLPWLIAAGVLFLTLASPYLYFFIKTPGHGFAKDSISNSADLLNFFIPTPMTWLSGQWVYSIARNYQTNLFEGGSYVGVIFIFIMISFFKHFKNHPAYKVILFSVLISFFASLGAYCHFGGTKILLLPWALFSHFPVLRYISPARFSCYFSLIMAVLVSIWLVNNQRSKRIKYLLVSLGIVMLFPSFSDFNYRGEWTQWVSAVSVPHYIKNNLYQRYILQGSHVLELPVNNDVCVHQALTNMYYKLVTGCVDGNPYGDRYQDLFKFFTTGQLFTDKVKGEFFSFLKESQVNMIIFDKKSLFNTMPFLSQLGKVVYQDNQYKMVVIMRKQ